MVNIEITLANCVRKTLVAKILVLVTLRVLIVTKKFLIAYTRKTTAFWAEDGDLHLVHDPVSGGLMKAGNGTLTIMFAGLLKHKMCS